METEVLGWAGTALVVVAYYPQIRHLYVERCAWGISVSTWLIWLAASALLLTYCVLRRDFLLGLVQGVNAAAIVTTLILVRRSDRLCPHHAKAAETASRL
ncbi:MAG TPA: PQ-loop repeat-containing protein [Pyrinomonadaceae bacterium]|nr:PQ-loop repeat-containing protein [Pyrinomonadaceae bacterium]